MKSLWKVVVPMLVVIIGSGCGASGSKLTQLDATVKKQQMNLRETIEQVDQNAAMNRETKNELAEIQRRLTELESKINTALTGESAEVQEFKENLAFINDQILRLDSSIRTKRPATQPSAASVFKPGGFEVKASYEAARAEYEQRRYEPAISGFNEVLTVAPASSLADNAQYWIGECYYSMGNFEMALEAFNKVFDYPESNKLADATLKLGLTYIKLKNTDSAKKELRAVLQNYPDSDAAKFARAELSKLGE
ncbi:MAG: tol-pal system protein YbgF [Candidatus Latescibacteria bacterium]|nr:tol-pal system protein YbgF [Candidatus Latescibacterota bacterium]